MQRVRQNDSMQTFVNSLKQFEKKMDKLQLDVNNHGNTLSELRSMMANLALIAGCETHMDDYKQPLYKNTGIQFNSQHNKIRRRQVIVEPSSKLKSKSSQGQKYGLSKRSRSDQSPKKVSVPVVKHHRPRKSEAPRRTVAIRPKPLDKTRTPRAHLK